MTKTIHQTIFFSASPSEVFEALMDEKKHAEFTGSSAKIERNVGGKFSVWDGYATGENKELVKDKLIVQTWRASDWPENAGSIVKFEISKENNRTKLNFTQTGVPKEFYEDVSAGWKDFYWKPMQKYLVKEKK